MRIKFDCHSLLFTSKGVGTSPLATSLPKMVPYFTGRQSECDEIVGHLTSDTTQLVSIWGSPGFGKTSVAIAVGHDLRNKQRGKAPWGRGCETRECRSVGCPYVV